MTARSDYSMFGTPNGKRVHAGSRIGTVIEQGGNGSSIRVRWDDGEESGWLWASSVTAARWIESDRERFGYNGEFA